MQLTVGLDRSDTIGNIEEYVGLGAGEFFAGFVPSEWSGRFGWEIGLNRRTFGGGCQYTDLEDLREAIDAIHGLGKRLMITLNAHDYGYQRLTMVRDIVETLETLGHDGYIVADPALMSHLRQWGVTTPFHLSTGGAAFNSETIRYFHERYGLRRVVIPRKMTLREMGVLMGNVSDLGLEFEVMIIGYRCHFNDEFCFSLHCGNKNNFCTNFVNSPKQVRGRFPANWKDAILETMEHPLEQFAEGSVLDEFCRTVARATPPERPTPAPKGGGESPSLPQTMYNNCGLCAIPRLRELGVHVLKVPVRGAPWQKRRYLQVVQQVVDNPAATAAECRALINSEGFCAQPDACYYHLGDRES
jgi:putative protease